MPVGPGSIQNPSSPEESDSLTYFERELAQTIEDSILESLEEDEEDDDHDHTEEEEDTCSD